MTKMITSGNKAVAAFRRFRALERAGGGGRAMAFDAAGSSGMTFLQSQLEQIDTDITRPLMATTHQRDITVRVGGGFVKFLTAYATNFGTTGGNALGLQGSQNTDIPQAQFNLNKGIWQAWDWAAAIRISYFDLNRMKQAESQGAPISLQQGYDESIAATWGKALDWVTYNGWMGQPGLVNNPSVPAFFVPDGGTGTAWSTKSPTLILNDINIATNAIIANCSYDIARGCPDSLLLPYNDFSQLTQPMSIGGVGYDSTLSYIEKHCVAASNGVKLKIYSLPDPWIAGKGQAGSNRGLLYRNTEENVKLQIPVSMQRGMTVQSTKDGGSYETLFVGVIGEVQWKRAQTAMYLDGI